jgi:hypothetical protein
VQHRSVLDEFVWTSSSERRNRVDKWEKAGFGQAGRYAEHILLGYAQVVEAVWMGLREWFYRGEPQIARKHDHPRIAAGQLD